MTNRIRKTALPSKSSEDVLPVASGPGDCLRLVREERGLSRQEIAEKLHLRLCVIEAIESDDYHALQGRNFVFIRGYLRAYAGLLGLSQDGLVQAFNQLELVEPSGRSLPPFAAVHGKSRRFYISKPKLLRALGYVLLSSCLLLAWKSYKAYSSGRAETEVVAMRTAVLPDRALPFTAALPQT